MGGLGLGSSAPSTPRLTSLPPSGGGTVGVAAPAHATAASSHLPLVHTSPNQEAGLLASLLLRMRRPLGTALIVFQ